MNFLRRCGPVAVGDVEYRPGGICGPRVQPDYQLVMLLTGELDLTLDQRKIHLDAGQAILLAPGHREYFRFSRTAESRHGWCAIHPASVPRRLRRDFAGLDRPAPFVGRMSMLLDRSRVRPATATPLHQDFYLGLGLALMCDFALTAGEESTRQPGAAALSRLENFIGTAYAEALSLTDLARNAGVSTQHLLKLCRSAGQATPTDQLYRKRMEVAAELLLGTGLAIGEIAERCGFANPFHFSRKFRSVFGRSPLTWRQQAWSMRKETRKS